MASIATIHTYRLLDTKQDSIADLDVEVYETILTLGNIIEVKNRLSKSEISLLTTLVHLFLSSQSNQPSHPRICPLDCKELHRI